ncbi:hypothetical protein, partial [Chloroflexus sp.]|uniref:hypothetical protein n=1 Tax=Chloroflexus sp. TaxID=1904827 RepID=UPI00404A96D3
GTPPPLARPRWGRGNTFASSLQRGEVRRGAGNTPTRPRWGRGNTFASSLQRGEVRRGAGNTPTRPRWGRE